MSVPVRSRVVLPALALAAAIPALVIPWLVTGDGHDVAARRFSVSSMSFAVFAEVAAHERAVQVAARRLAAYQALPPEVMERTLAEVAAGYPALARLWVVDPNGRVIAAWQAPRGGEDPSPTRRAAIKNAPYTYVGVAGAAGAGDRIELAQPIQTAGLLPTAFVIADLSTTELTRLLAESESRHGLELALAATDGGGGHVIYPPGGVVPAGGWQGDAGYGMTLHVQFPGAFAGGGRSGGRVLAGSVGSAVGAFLLAALLLPLTDGRWWGRWRRRRQAM